MRPYITTITLVFSCLLAGCGGENTGGASQNQTTGDSGGVDSAAPANADAGLDSSPRACSGVSATYDIGTLDQANYICKSPNDCTVCVQTVDDAGMPVQWFEIPLAHCICPTPTVRVQRDQ